MKELDRAHKNNRCKKDARTQNHGDGETEHIIPWDARLGNTSLPVNPHVRAESSRPRATLFPKLKTTWYTHGKSAKVKHDNDRKKRLSKNCGMTVAHLWQRTTVKAPTGILPAQPSPSVVSREKRITILFVFMQMALRIPDERLDYLRRAHGPAGARDAVELIEQDVRALPECTIGVREKWRQVKTVLQTRIDKLWLDFWAGGITNPLTVIEKRRQSPIWKRHPQKGVWGRLNLLGNSLSGTHDESGPEIHCGNLDIMSQYIVIGVCLALLRGGDIAARNPGPKASCVFLHPVRLTVGPGNDTEAAWSPDGRRIAFQSDRAGRSRLYVLDTSTNYARRVDTGPGYAMFPAWLPDGKRLMYASVDYPGTALEGFTDGVNLFEIDAGGGPPRRLTHGLHRDYTPVCAPGKGGTVLFASTRGGTDGRVALFRLRLDGADSAPERFLEARSRDAAFMEPSFSPDGRFLVCAAIHGFRDNWRLQVMRADAPRDGVDVTNPELGVFYAPAWSPDGRWIACTGWRPGDPGWQLYVIQVPSGHIIRLDVGPGNSRSPAWSPDTAELVFENNRTGTYNLYRARFPADKAEEAARIAAPGSRDCHALVSFRFDGLRPDADPAVPDTVLPVQAVGRLAVGPSGGVMFPRKTWLALVRPAGFAFGDGPFTVRVEIMLLRRSGKLEIIAVGRDPRDDRGWQIFLRENGQACFNSRASDHRFVGAFSDGALPLGRRVVLVGVRGRGGRVDLYVDGKRQGRSGWGAAFRYRIPTEVRIGAQFDGRHRFRGVLYAFSVYPCAASRNVLGMQSLAQFLENDGKARDVGVDGRH